MAIKKLNYERAAKILCDAVLMGDRRAAEKWKTTIRTIIKYRKRLETDEELGSHVRRLQEKQDADWAGEIPGVLAEGMAYLRAAFVENLNSDQGTANPEMIAALTGAIDTLADIDLTRQLIKERLKDAQG